MPFLTEELWQRLPRRPKDSCPSIVKAAYPKFQKDLDDPASEAAYELILAVSKSIRSLTAEYSIKESANVYIQPFTTEAHFTCKTQLPSIRSLAGKPMLGQSASIALLTSTTAKPAGCVARPVSAEAAVYLHIKGRVVIDAEISKAKTRLAKAMEGVDKQRIVLDGLEKAGKMDKGVAEGEMRRLEDARRKVSVLEESVSQFERLKLE
ncbi:MAG: valine--tRNA ligase [Ramalina farinacea]|uniref:valine--tRNA ligase n=1 Tax=Ramalina farinacea TaxID=258253 RepID=A0AA43QGV2_9LECA|nr:valine--tRNA ligase [Ramalina farinacea]